MRSSPGAMAGRCQQELLPVQRAGREVRRRASTCAARSGGLPRLVGPHRGLRDPRRDGLAVPVVRGAARSRGVLTEGREPAQRRRAGDTAGTARARSVRCPAVMVVAPWPLGDQRTVSPPAPASVRKNDCIAQPLPRCQPRNSASTEPDSIRELAKPGPKITQPVVESVQLLTEFNLRSHPRHRQPIRISRFVTEPVNHLRQLLPSNLPRIQTSIHKADSSASYRHTSWPNHVSSELCKRPDCKRRRMNHQEA